MRTTMITPLTHTKSETHLENGKDSGSNDPSSICLGKRIWDDADDDDEVANQSRIAGVCVGERVDAGQLHVNVERVETANDEF